MYHLGLDRQIIISAYIYKKTNSTIPGLYWKVGLGNQLIAANLRGQRFKPIPKPIGPSLDTQREILEYSSHRVLSNGLYQTNL